MAVDTTWALSKNQLLDNTNQLDEAGEARLYAAFRHYWHPVIYSHEVTDKPERVVLLEHQLVVVRLNGEVHTYNDLCAHRGSALSLGTVVRGEHGDELRCPYHGWQYDDKGLCTFTPQRPDLAGQLRARVQRYPTKEAYGMVWVCLEEEPRFPLPQVPTYGQPGFVFRTTPSTNWKCSAPRRTENYTDLAHFAIVHDGTLGDVNEPEIPPHRVWREDDGVLRMYFQKELSAREAGGSGEGSVMSERIYHVYMPLTVHLDITIGENKYILFFHPSPIGPKEIRNFTLAGRNYGNDDPVRVEEDLVRLNQIVYDEDQPVVESQRPEMLSEDLALELHLKEVDTFSLNYRKWLVEIARELEAAA
jgi:phenylpropionate dioxygenase-like ring-hydroxylating dioxygenase large terminal subunit